MLNSGRLSEDKFLCPKCDRIQIHFHAVVDREGLILYYGGEECECGQLVVAGKEVQDGDDNS